ncbi:MAG: YihA family ribosome biogenesis GTP-binding protein [Proteobacteria bacterium]|nr:YihA family ribosome biogenesis GTP-binding protein [Pseudomonadota bacterium]
MSKKTKQNVTLKYIEGSKAHLVFSAHPDEVFPEESISEVAFIGRSNVGKSSLINAFLGRNKLARTSNTPGATRSIHFYDIEKFLLVDLPGYGYAKLSKAKSAQINRWVSSYLGSRRSLKLVCVLVDSRHGLKDSDRNMLRVLAELGVQSQVILTKLDKAKAAELKKSEKTLFAELKNIVGTNPHYIKTSAATRAGIEDLEQAIIDMIQ